MPETQAKTATLPAAKTVGTKMEIGITDSGRVALTLVAEEHSAIAILSPEDADKIAEKLKQTADMARRMTARPAAVQ